MRKISGLSLLLPFIICFIGCVPERHAYFLSPTNSNANPYAVIPMKTDSLRSANYISALYNIGSANDLGYDNVLAFQLRFHRSHNFGIFQAFYGANISLGSYVISDYFRTKYSDSPNVYGNYYPPYQYFDTVFRVTGRSSFFGNYGFTGGINMVIPFEKGEWRPLGIEMSVQNEFGNYLNFRKTLPDSAADIVFRKSFTATLGFYMDIIGKNRHGTEFGYKISYGFPLNSINNYYRNVGASIFPMCYLSNTFHLTKKRITAFMQANVGTYAQSFQTGVSCRIGK